MGKVIQVDFQNRCKVESYTITEWKCMVCRVVHQLDSRQKAPARILVREAAGKKEAEHICKACCIQLGTIANKEGWTADED